MAVTVGELEAKLKADVSSFVAGMNSATQAFQNTAKTIQQGSSNMSGLTTQINGVQGAVTKLGSKMNMAFAAIGAGFILPQIFGAAKSAVIDFNQQVDQATVALTNFLGSGSAAKDMIKELQDFAARTPFQFKDLLGTTQSMMAMGVAAEDVLPRMQAIGDAAAAMGGSAEVLQRIQRALGQIQAKGRVQGEELLQLAEAGIPAYKYLSTVYGGSTSALMSEMKKGAVDSTTAINALLDGMQQDFGGMMEEQSKTMMGAMSTVMDYVQMTIGAIFRPVFETLRDTFVALSELLSSADMKNAASSFAKGIADVLGQVKVLAGAFAQQLKKPFMDFMQSLSNIIKVALKLAAALKPMVTAVLIPMGAAFIVIAQVLMPIVSSLTALAAVISQNQIVMYALAGLLMGKMLTGLLATQRAAGGLTGATTRMMQAFGASGKAAAFAFANMRDAGMSMGASIKGAMMSASFSVKAFGVAIKTALIELLPLVIAFIVVGKAMQAFSDRNKDANERTKELTGSIKEQTDAILAQENALTALASNGLDPLNKALTTTGKEGEETTNALIALGKSGSDYVQVMRDFKTNTEASAYALAQQKGFTDEQAKAMANYVATADKGTDAQHRNSMEFLNFTPAMIAATMQMEQLDDASENTNFATMTQGIIQATIRSNEATQAFLDQATAMVEKEIASGKAMSADEKAIAIYEEFIKRAGEYEESQKAIARANGEVSVTTHMAVTSIQTLIDGLKDGKIESEDFLAALIGTAQYAKVSATQAYYDMSKGLTDFGDSLKDTKGSQDALVGSGYELLDMIGANSARIIAMGGSVGDVDSALIQSVKTFYKFGQMAGWSKDKLGEVLQMMNLVDKNGDIVLNIDVETERLEKALKIFAGLGGADALVYAQISSQLAKLNEQKKRSLALDLKILKLPKTASTKAGDDLKKKLQDLRDSIRDVYEKGLEDAKGRIQNAKDAQEDYAQSVSDTIKGLASLSDAYDSISSKHSDLSKTVSDAMFSMVSFTGIINEQTAAQNALKQAISGQSTAQTEVNNLQAEQLRLLAQYKRASTREEQLKIYDELARNTERLTDAQDKLVLSDKAVADAQKESDNAGKSFVEGLRLKVQAAKDFANKLVQLRSLGLNELAITQIVGAGAVAGGQMADELISGAAAGLNSVSDTNKLINEAKALADSIGTNIADSFYDIGTTGGGATIDAFNAQAQKATEFAEKIKKLVALGLNETSLQQVLAAGVTAGGKIADQLIAGGKDTIEKTNAIQKSLENAAGSAAQAAAKSYYDAGVSFAQAIYDGLKAKWDLLKPQLDKMTEPQLQKTLDEAKVTVPALVTQPGPDTQHAGKPIMDTVFTPVVPEITFTLPPDFSFTLPPDIAAQISRDAGGLAGYSIPAPAPAPVVIAPTVMPDLNFDLGSIDWGSIDFGDMFAGISVGGLATFATGGVVTKPTIGLIGEGGESEAIIPLSKLGNMVNGNGGTNIYLTVTAGMGTNGSQVGQEIVNELIAWQRRNGALPVRVQ